MYHVLWLFYYKIMFTEPYLCVVKYWSFDFFIDLTHSIVLIGDGRFEDLF